MKKFSRVTCIIATLAAMLVSGAAQRAPSQSPAVYDCTYLTYNMMDCAEFLMVGGSETTPQSRCCLGLKILVEANAKCVCFALNLADNLGLHLNITRALALPSYCRVSAPSLATCHVSDFPDGSPAPSPLPPPSSIGGSPAATYGVDSSPVPAPSKSSSIIPRPAISSISVFIFILCAVLLFVNA